MVVQRGAVADNADADASTWPPDAGISGNVVNSERVMKQCSGRAIYAGYVTNLALCRIKQLKNE